MILRLLCISCHLVLKTITSFNGVERSYNDANAIHVEGTYVMSWAIIADSSCNLRGYTPKAPDTTYRFAPLKINVAGEEFVDDEDLDVAELNRRVASEESASSSSCPSAGEWAELFRTADNVIAITISANLSGSYEAANMARELVANEGERNIFIVNSRAAGGKLELLVVALDTYLTEHPDASFNEVTAYICSIEQRSTVMFLLSSYENLAKAGRMPKMAGILANKLNIRMLGCASNEGTIKVLGPARSQKKAFEKIVACMRNDGYDGGPVFIDHVFNEKAAEGLAERIKREWGDAVVTCMPCGGLCSYYAETDGLIVGYGW